jgi:hypothetical protein
VGLFVLAYVLCSRDEGELVPKLVWRVKLVAELPAGVTTEVEVVRLERDEQACRPIRRVPGPSVELGRGPPCSQQAKPMQWAL